MITIIIPDVQHFWRNNRDLTLKKKKKKNSKVKHENNTSRPDK